MLSSDTIIHALPKARSAVLRSAPYPVALFGLLLALTALIGPSPASAFVEPNTLAGAGCSCHDVHGGPSLYAAAGGDCVTCHGSSNASGFSGEDTSGPHGGYTTTTRKCAACHSVHNASPEGIILLPAATVVATCRTCHDGTSGWGVYGTIEARGVTVSGGHANSVTSVVPGGDSATGGDAAVLFSGPTGTLICTDCHSPHGSDVVAPFVGERNRIRTWAFTSSPETSKLLRRVPTGAIQPVLRYGSDWCLACHAGRDSGGTVHNHPVDSEMATDAPYDYGNIAVLASDGPTSLTVIGALGGLAPTVPEHGALGGVLSSGRNLGFLMPYPRTEGPGGQVGHAPICQQCHEDARDCGVLSADGSQGDAAPFSVAFADSTGWSGSSWTTTTVDNPRFQNFPHETENYRMLVETDDDLCLNCHPHVQLP